MRALLPAVNLLIKLLQRYARRWARVELAIVVEKNWKHTNQVSRENGHFVLRDFINHDNGTIILGLRRRATTLFTRDTIIKPFGWSRGRLRRLRRCSIRFITAARISRLGRKRSSLSTSTTANSGSSNHGELRLTRVEHSV
jgi:hypothetical protein